MVISSIKTMRAAFYICWLLMLPGFFVTTGKWAILSEIIIFLLFFCMGAFLVLAKVGTIAEFWGKDSRVGRAFTDPTNGRITLFIARFIGSSFMIVMLYVAINIVIRHHD